MSAEVVTITDEVFDLPLTRAGADRAVTEAGHVAAIMTLPRFAAWRECWRKGARAKRAQLRAAQTAEELRDAQERQRMAHVFDDVLADIAQAGEQGAKFAHADDRRVPSDKVPPRVKPEDEQALVRQGREVMEMIKHPGWPVVMRHVADRVRACALALESCPPDQRGLLQATIANLTKPISSIFQNAVRLGMCVEKRRDERKP